MVAKDEREFSLKVTSLTRRFGRRSVFRGVSFSCDSGQSVCITGRNGSGKSTLLRIIAGLLAPSEGYVVLTVSGSKVDAVMRRRIMRLVSSDLDLYDELTGLENLRFLSEVSGDRKSREHFGSMLDSVGLGRRGDDLVREYSTGMKQRLRLAAALMSDPAVLLLDEPCSSLDDDGREMVYRAMVDQKSRGILVFATNETDERRFGDEVVALG